MGLKDRFLAPLVIAFANCLSKRSGLSLLLGNWSSVDDDVDGDEETKPEQASLAAFLLFFFVRFLILIPAHLQRKRD